MQRTKLVEDTQERLLELLEELTLGRGSFGARGGSRYGFGEWRVQRTKLVDDTQERLLELLEELTLGQGSFGARGGKQV